MRTRLSTLCRQWSIAGVIVVTTSCLNAATITWQTAQNTTGKSDLIEGNVVHALNGGAAITINNGGSSGNSSYSFAATQYSSLTFAPTITSNALTGASNGAATTGDAQFDTLLNTLTYTTSGTTSGTQTIGGLTIGKTYQVQLFYNDQRSGLSGRVMTYGDGTNTVNVSAGGGGHGRHAIGTFVADSTTQSLTHASNGFGNVHFNALLVVESSSIPTVTLTTASNPVSAAYNIDVTFSEPITGLVEPDFTITNGTIQVSSLSGAGKNWTITVIPTANGDVSVTLPASSVTDTDGDNNVNTVSNTLETTYIAPGGDQPAPTLSTPNSVVFAPYPVAINFTEPVTGLGLNDFAVTNAALSNLSGAGASYSVLVTPTTFGNVTIDLPKNKVTDLDGNSLMNAASNQLVTSYAEPLTVSVYGGSTTANPEFDINLSFSEAVNGLEVADFQVTNGSVVSITALGRREFANRYFTVSLRADAPGQVQIVLLASQVTSITTPTLGNQASAPFTMQCTSDFATAWTVDDAASWTAAQKTASNITLANGFAEPTATNAQFSSITKTFPNKRKARSVTFKQSDVWDNWTGVPNVGASGAGDATILLPIGDNDYYHLGRGSTGGYHAWHSTDMVNWTHHGPITAPVHRWVTSAEYKEGTFYIYVDHPNDHTPHLYTDNDLKDGVIGTFMGMAFNDPTHGSDCSVFRDNEDGLFHIIHEDWTPLKASTHAWDSPLAGHTSSADGFTAFKPAEHLPPVDERTTPTGATGTYNHPHVAGTHISNPLTYQVHSPDQNAYGDWTSIKIGSQYYLFSDFDIPGGGITSARFTSGSIYQEFERVGTLGSGHPDPTVGFAEGKFYLITQQSTDYTSPGPWVEGVEARAGVDTDGNGTIDQWTAWQTIKEAYSHTPGYARVVTRAPAMLDLSALPAGFGFEFEFKIDNSIVPAVSPIMDRVEMVFDPNNFQKWSNEEETSAIIDGDHNNNDIPNLIEFATGITSTEQILPDGQNQVSITMSNESLEDGYSLILQHSSNLNDWTTTTAATTPVKLLLSTAQPNGDLLLQFEVNNTAATNLFWRIKIE